MILGAVGLIASGVFILGDPDDLIGAWLQIGIGIGLMGASLRTDSLTGGLWPSLATSIGLLVGHVAVVANDGECTIGPGIIIALAVLVVLNGAALVGRVRSELPGQHAA